MKTTATKKFFSRYFQLIFLIALIVFGVIFRFLPHPPNFAPIATIGLFSGLLIKRKRVLFVPLVAMLVSDYFIGSYQPQIMISVYLSFGLIALIGYLNKKINIQTTIGASLIGSIIFFALTNLAVWKFSGLYPQTQTGLTQCFYLALPFFRNTIAGNLTFATSFYLLYKFSKQYLELKLREGVKV